MRPPDLGRGRDSHVTSVRLIIVVAVSLIRHRQRQKIEMSQLDFKTSQSPASAGSGPLDPLAKSLQPEIPLETSHWLPKDYHFDPRSLKTSFENDTTALENPAGCLSKGYVCSIQGCENPLDSASCLLGSA